ncbi:protein kinase superfamily protein [Actinidia rufa]|uniref:Protein kinase superfamily protein n=1 Tax=Actinidia rufa TaxID=165716 RepID=A0A7J0F6E2_9ERIC|nr:protein kinase superfamily protein [Actinidia rufa]
MEKFPWYKISFSSFLLLLLLSLLQLASFSAYDTPKQYLIDCGSKSDTNFSGQNFLRDQNSDSVSFSSGSSRDSDNNPTTNTSLIYKTARIFKRTSSYKFRIDENGTYLVRLHFHAFNDLSGARFNVSASGFSLLSNFSVQNNRNAVTKEFFVHVNETEFQICFWPLGETSLAFVNALEVILIPGHFLSPEAFHISHNISHNWLVAKVLQPTHRINVGGEMIEPDSDSWGRKWKPDGAYLLDQKNTEIKFLDGDVKYEKGNATRAIAPELVYRTARSLASESNSSNIIWRFDVGKNGTNLLRLHFCDIISISKNTLSFNLSINEFSVTIVPYYIFEDLAAPFCLDFMVDSDESGLVNISVGVLYPNERPFLNGLEIMEFMEESGLACTKDELKESHLPLVVGLTVGSGVLVFTLVMVFFALKCRRKFIITSDVSNLNLGLKIPFAEIKRATNNFDKRRVIGGGGFGKVYRGTLRNGVEVAVKRGQPEHGQGFLEFHTEITILSRIRHRHLVSLIGYCDEKSEMILVYEFMENGTLRDHLYDWNKSLKKSDFVDNLSWKQRLEICIGSAEGLHYLHTSSDGGIIHRDVKSTNILLDKHYVAKVADFGISRSAHLDQTYISTEIKGSFGYLDPEYFGNQQLTKKSDVYSFGVVLLEILCARPAIDASLPSTEANLAEWAMALRKRGRFEEAIDSRIVREINPSSLRKFWETIEKCLKDCGTDRPTMYDVLWDLKYVLELQQTVIGADPCEDSTTDASLQLPVVVSQRLLSSSFLERDEIIVTTDEASDATSIEVFSQLKIDEPR